MNAIFAQIQGAIRWAVTFGSAALALPIFTGTVNTTTILGSLSAVVTLVWGWFQHGSLAKANVTPLTPLA